MVAQGQLGCADENKGRAMRSLGTRVAAVAVAGLIAALLTAAPAVAGRANAGIGGSSPSNPIAGVKWRPYEGPADPLWSAYASASGNRARVLGRLALKPRAFFTGSWTSSSRIRDVAAAIVRDTQQGDPNVLAQFGTFALTPWEHAWSGQGQWNVAREDDWYSELARGIGNARALVILQIDLPFAAQTPNQQPEAIDSYGAQVLAANSHTTVYVDAGAYQWLSPAEQGDLLIRNGIRYARGFSVNDTQYGSIGQELRYGAQIVDYLRSRHIEDKHFLVNTAQNGQPYLAGEVAGNSNDTPRCASRGQTLCQRTGIPPTTDVANPRWHLSPSDARIAKQEVDGYVWASQPWDVNGGPFSLSFALNLGANGQY